MPGRLLGRTKPAGRPNVVRGMPILPESALVAGLTVGVVALPLALAFGITSGMGATPGLVTAIVAGVVAALLGGSNVQVSGPTGAMAVVLVPVVTRYGIAAVYTVGLIAGTLVVVAAVLRLGRYVAFVPWPVKVMVSAAAGIASATIAASPATSPAPPMAKRQRTRPRREASVCCMTALPSGDARGDPAPRAVIAKP